MALKHKLAYHTRLFFTLLAFAWFIVLCTLGFQLTHMSNSVGRIDWYFFAMLLIVGVIASALIYNMVRSMVKKEEEERLKIKRQLTNNINHELKTPVASIQVCIETLLHSKNLTTQKQQELLKHSYAHCERLRRLLSDVSLITRIEEGSQNIEKENINIYNIVADIQEEIACRPTEQRMNIHLDLPKDLPLQGNSSLIDSIFRNLIENAISYSGGKNIYIQLQTYTTNSYRFVLEDDGCGVDNQHLPHLFERFYRADKGRSRKMGGTGLGLSIVKHAIQFHGGNISVENRRGGGLRFEFSLKG